MEIFARYRRGKPGKGGADGGLRVTPALLGIQTERRVLNRQFLNRQGRPGLKFIFSAGDCRSEFQYLAIDYLQIMQGKLTAADLPNLQKLVVRKSWWDTIDALDVIIGGVALRYPELNKILLEWSLDDNIWLRRVAIDHQLTRKEKTDPALLERIIVNLGQTEFFINKAIGWSLRNYSKTDPNWVRAFIPGTGSGWPRSASGRRASTFEPPPRIVSVRLLYPGNEKAEKFLAHGCPPQL